jgi:hypothetical protein
MNRSARCKGSYVKPEKRKYTRITLIMNSESFGYLIFKSTKHSSLNTIIPIEKHPINKLPNTKNKKCKIHFLEACNYEALETNTRTKQIFTKNNVVT